MAILGITGICYDDKSSFLRGAAEGPGIIRTVLHDGSANYFAETGLDPFPHIVDEGDPPIAGYMQIEGLIDDILTRHERILVWGGDHSITYPIVRSMAKNKGRFDILHIDAHGDLYDDYEGDKHSHACPFARIMEEKLCGQLTQIGIRTLTPHQRDQIARWKIRCIEMNSIEKMNDLSFEKPLYISIDLDGFDPAYAPGVSHHEPGGLIPREVINFIQKIKVPIVGADIVEYNPRRDHGHMTAYLAAKLTKELAAKIVS